MGGRPSISETAAFLLVLAAALGYVSAHLPAAGEYRLNADEGVYYGQALAILQDGPRGLRALGDEYVRDPSAQLGPPPLRIGHLVPAALALAVRPSIRTLSILSLICYAGLCVTLFFFVARLWDARIAAVAGICAAVSPLGWGLATRALVDTDHALFSTLTLFTLILWLTTGRRRHFAIFAAVLAWCLLVKETAWVDVIFAVGAMTILRLAGQGAIRLRHIAIAGIGVPAVVLLVYVAAFGGAARALAVIEVAHRANVSQPNAYLVAYGSGPWYEYVVDFLLLSPVVTLLFLLFCGRTISVEKRDLPTVLVLLFVCFVAGALTFVAKNPRFVLPLDPMLRLGAGAMIVSLAANARNAATRVAIVAALTGLVVTTDARAFQRYFVVDRIYDPVAANLLSSAGFLPPPPAAGPAGAPASADTYVALSLEAYQRRDFRTAIRMAEAAIAIEPASAEAYNNLGAAHAELGEWEAAIAALETALRLKPDFPRARNNLTWARDGLARR